MASDSSSDSGRSRARREPGWGTRYAGPFFSAGLRAVAGLLPDGSLPKEELPFPLRRLERVCLTATATAPTLRRCPPDCGLERWRASRGQPGCSPVIRGSPGGGYQLGGHIRGTQGRREDGQLGRTGSSGLSMAELRLGGSSLFGTAESSLCMQFGPGWGVGRHGGLHQAPWAVMSSRQHRAGLHGNSSHTGWG
jgi:hypothetical protein